jgi:hypothetical protein
MTHYLRLDVRPGGFFLAVPEAIDVAPATMLAMLAGVIPAIDKDLVLERMAVAQRALREAHPAGHC